VVQFSEPNVLTISAGRADLPDNAGVVCRRLIEPSDVMFDAIDPDKSPAAP
jgi:hypothetical protein